MHVRRSPATRYTPLLELRPELRRDRQPVLGVEVVFEGAGEGQGACQSRSGREGQSIPGGGVGGAPPPGNGFANGKYPTSPHSATRNPHDVPHRPSLTSAHESARFAGISRGTVSCSATRSCSVQLQRAICTRDCALEGRSGPPWGGVGGIAAQRVVSAGISAAATSSSTAGTSSSATTSWIFGAALAACSRALRGSQRPRLGAPGRRAWRRVGRRGARRGAARRRAAAMPSAGQRASRWSSVGVGGLAQRARGRRRA